MTPECQPPPASALRWLPPGQVPPRGRIGPVAAQGWPPGFTARSTGAVSSDPIRRTGGPPLTRGVQPRGCRGAWPRASRKALSLPLRRNPGSAGGVRSLAHAGRDDLADERAMAAARAILAPHRVPPRACTAFAPRSSSAHRPLTRRAARSDSRQRGVRVSRHQPQPS